ncbi:hypothetical protein BH23GEM9_BH23GEM9_17310 [soil metagenome]
MSGLEIGPLLALAGLGALHGVNPAMGWLFAVALGLQERKGSAVWRALPPLAVGHALSVAVFVMVAVLAGTIMSPAALRWGVAASLIAFALHRMLRGHRHPAFGGMRVTRRDLVIWSFLMASAHGAGLMVLPFVIGDDARHGAAAAASAVMYDAAHAGHAAHAAHAAVAAEALRADIFAGQLAGLVVSLIHALSYLLVAGIIAIVVYQRFGVRLLRTAWINLDIIWIAALLVTAVVVVLPALREL